MDAYGPTLTAMNIRSNTSSSSWHAPPKFNFNSLLALLNHHKSDAFIDKDNDNWNWNWKPIDFKLSAVKCPKDLNILLGRRFSACNPSAVCESAAFSSHECSCNSNKDPLPVEIEQNKDISSRENAIEDELEEGQMPGDTDVPIEQNKDRSSRKNGIEDEDLEEGQISGEMEIPLEQNKDRRSRENATEDEDLEEGQISGEMEILPEQNKDRRSRENATEDEDLEEGQISGEVETLLEQEGEDANSKQAATASQFESHCIVPRNSAFFLNEAPVPRIPETSKRKKANNQRRKRQRQNKAKRSAQPQGKKNEKEEKERNLIAEFKVLEFADKETGQRPPNQDKPDEEKSTAKKDVNFTLSSFLEGKIGLWTTQTVDDVLRDTKAEEDGRKKAKRGPLTAERKLKKKIVKKRKRALKDKQLGIKRLKLVPVTKPKPVILCKFYMKGRCSQGKECPFSHDAVPITKSEICKYYINNCCLKGDECPFSHDLSSFPCKFYHSEGGCLDGDACRFSHKNITANELEKILKQTELGESCESERIQSTTQQNTSNILQKSQVHITNSVGNESLGPNSLRPLNSLIEKNEQVYDEKVANSEILSSGEAPSNECFGFSSTKKQDMPTKNETSSWVSGNSSFLEYNGFDDLLNNDGGDESWLSARRAALSALAPVADHEARLTPLGLVRVPIFSLTAFSAADRVLDANYHSYCTPSEQKGAPEMCCSESFIDENKNTPPTGFLKNSKSAMEILENMLLGNKNPNKQTVCSPFSSCNKNGDTDNNK